MAHGGDGELDGEYMSPSVNLYVSHPDDDDGVLQGELPSSGSTQTDNTEIKLMNHTTNTSQ